ncbi:MAG: pyrroloquinoline quinone biosynthesis protein PqqB [Bryobacterales bacterium]|nr:pyrroloquinoline quinone biosynthesis protein PqqB [Bryobacterales bacterium]
MNASPDLRYQIESFPSLHPCTTSLRHSPIDGVVLTSAEVDAALGLLLLRESQPIAVYATDAVRRLLMEDNDLFRVLQRQQDQVRWHRLVPGETTELKGVAGSPSGIRCTPISSGGGFPGHVPVEKSETLDPAEAVLGLLFEHEDGSMAFFPGAPSVRTEWLQAIASCDALLFDGTFWSEDELIRTQGHGKTARQMGHSPMSGADGTLESFAGVQGPRKIFIHINNTNPVLDEDSPEFKQIRAAGWELAFDGMELSF